MTRTSGSTDCTDVLVLCLLHISTIKLNKGQLKTERYTSELTFSSETATLRRSTLTFLPCDQLTERASLKSTGISLQTW